MPNISEEHLKDLQEKVGAIQNIQSQIGGLEAQKHAALHVLANQQEELQKVQQMLEEEYGKVSINIQDGSYEPIEEDVPVSELAKA
jgi:transcription initiation factor IIF auxiliary subunit